MRERMQYLICEQLMRGEGSISKAFLDLQYFEVSTAHIHNQELSGLTNEVHMADWLRHVSI
jgi:hypothetical protein